MSAESFLVWSCAADRVHLVIEPDGEVFVKWPPRLSDSD